MSKHTRALKKAERDFAKATAKLEALQAEQEKVQQALGEEPAEDETEAARKELVRIEKGPSEREAQPNCSLRQMQNSTRWIHVRSLVVVHCLVSEQNRLGH